MRASLVAKGCWNVTNSGAHGANATRENKSEQALTLITLALEEDHMIHIADCSTSRDDWKKLSRIYIEQRVNNRLRLYKLC